MTRNEVATTIHSVPCSSSATKSGELKIWALDPESLLVAENKCIVLGVWIHADCASDLQKLQENRMESKLRAERSSVGRTTENASLRHVYVYMFLYSYSTGDPFS